MNKRRKKETMQKVNEIKSFPIRLAVSIIRTIVALALLAIGLFFAERLIHWKMWAVPGEFESGVLYLLCLLITFGGIPCGVYLISPILWTYLSLVTKIGVPSKQSMKFMLKWFAW